MPKRDAAIRFVQYHVGRDSVRVGGSGRYLFIYVMGLGSRNLFKAVTTSKIFILSESPFKT